MEVAEVFGVTRQAIWKWLKSYHEDSSKVLKAKRQGPPEGEGLLPWESARISKTVIDHCPHRLKLPFYLWTREAVAELVERRFSIRLSFWTVRQYLARWCFPASPTIINDMEPLPCLLPLTSL
ncbi:MAG: winged helix-turn-helix domain-containing protein [Candidatus Hodarchaeota archaeon]